MTTHTIPVSTKQNADRYDHGHHVSGATILVAGSNNRAGWGLSSWGSEGFGRIVFQGPRVQGPHASLFGKCSVMAADPAMSTGGELRRLDAEGLLFRVESGDILDIDGTRYTVGLCRRGYPTLTVQADDSADEALAQWAALYGDALA